MPRKRAFVSAVRAPLAFALGTPAKVAALRALAGAGEPVTQRDLARRAGVQHRSIQLALNELVLLGIVHRQAGGRDYLVRLSEAHRLAAPLRALFDAEACHFVELRRRLAEFAHAIAPRAALSSVALFGSAARARDVLASDCDLLVVARTAAGVSRAIDAFSDAAVDIQRTFGCRLAPIGYARADAAKRWRAKSLPFNEIRRDALVLFGPPLDEAFRGPR